MTTKYIAKATIGAINASINTAAKSISDRYANPEMQIQAVKHYVIDKL